LSQPTRFYIEVQDFLRKRFLANNPPTTSQIQRAVFRRSFDQDSQYQRQIIYFRIAEGRENALKQWDLYCESADFTRDYDYINTHKDQNVLNGDRPDYYDFYSALLRGRFGEETEDTMEYLNEYIVISKLWNTKLVEYSQNMNNLVISTYGKGAIWKLPSWWRWAIRETDLYLRCLKTLQKQFNRGISTKLLTASGQPLQRAVGYTTSIEGLLQDGQSWTCPNCGMYNSGSSKYCSNCGQANTNNTIV